MPTCSNCYSVKEYLKQNNIKFEDLDISADDKLAIEMKNKTGQFNVPVIIIEKNNKEEIIIDFDKKKIDKIILGK